MPTKSKPKSGHAYNEANGLQAIGVSLPTADLAALRGAAGIAGKSMAKFAREAIMEAVHKFLKDKGVKLFGTKS